MQVEGRSAHMAHRLAGSPRHFQVAAAAGERPRRARLSDCRCLRIPCPRSQGAHVTLRLPFAYVANASACVLLHNTLIIAADAVGSPLWLAVLLSFCVVTATGYVLHSLFTFRRPLAAVGFARYAFAMSANIPLAFLTIWFWHEQFGLSMVLAAPLASVCMMAANFALGFWAIGAIKAKSDPRI